MKISRLIEKSATTLSTPAIGAAVIKTSLSMENCQNFYCNVINNFAVASAVPLLLIILTATVLPSIIFKCFI